MKKIVLTPLFFFTILLLNAQEPRVEVLTSGTGSSLRGLSVVNDNVVWVSGSKGTVGRSTNAGKSWKWITVKGFEKAEFRDIEAFDANTAVIMAIQDPAYILKTTDGGETWKIVYENKTKGMFLDAMDFADNQRGIVIGDPVDGRAFIAVTSNSGNTWEEMDINANKTAVDSGEAFFAASGTNVKYFSNKQYVLVSGGLRSRLLRNNGARNLPLIQGKETTGANSIDVFDDGRPNKPGNRMIVVGGDFLADSSREKNCFYSNDGGKTWHAPVTPPWGYRSCVEYLSKKDVLTCGINGVDISSDGGRTWRWLSKEGFNVCRIARLGTAIFLAGNNGKVGRIVWE